MNTCIYYTTLAHQHLQITLKELNNIIKRCRQNVERNAQISNAHSQLVSNHIKPYSVMLQFRLKEVKSLKNEEITFLNHIIELSWFDTEMRVK